MKESVGQTAVRKSVLEDKHVQLCARMKVEAGWSIPESFGDSEAEYAAVRSQSAGILDLSSRGRLLVSGSEAVAFLNGLITNDMKSLAENHWMPAVFPNVQGRLVASVRVIRIKDDLSTGKSVPQFLIDTEPLTYDAVLKSLNRFTVAGDFRVTDMTDELALISLQGKEALSILQSTLQAAVNCPQYQVQQFPWGEEELHAVRATHTSENGFDLLVTSVNAVELWERLVKTGAKPVGFEAFETLRIEAGRPRYGLDMDETNVVSETNLDDAVSFTKGCYVGQEIIARIKYRGHVAKKLTGLMFAEAGRSEPGEKLFSQEGKEIGQVRSVTFSPALNRQIALAYVKYDYLAPGTAVQAGDERINAVVAELPFIRGSWYGE